MWSRCQRPWQREMTEAGDYRRSGTGLQASRCRFCGELESLILRPEEIGGSSGSE